jgi:hypothetical protein
MCLSFCYSLFKAAKQPLQDGLPADAWTNIDNSLGGRTPTAGQRESDFIVNSFTGLPHFRQLSVY